MPIERSQEEETVKRWGFSLVSTNTFGPWAKLPKHSHTDLNTHLIVSGSMIMTDYGVDGYHHVQMSVGLRPRDRNDVPAHVSYGGVAGPEGVVFVEGRQNLSAGLEYRRQGLPTPANLVRPFVPVRWTGARAKVVEYESRDYTPKDSLKPGYSSSSGGSLSSASSRASLTPVEGLHEWRLQPCRINQALINNKDDGNDSSHVRSTWAWLWQRYWYGTE